MNRMVTVAVLAVSLVTAPGPVGTSAQAAPLAAGPAASGQAVPGEYVVVLRPGADVHLIGSGVTKSAVYSHAVTGFAAALSDVQVRALQRHPDVLAIEPNRMLHALGMQRPTPNWGLDRIDQRNLPLDDTYRYHADGSGVTAYVLDTGIDPSHPDFGGRAAVGYDALGGDGLDCNGHGTHVAGIVGSTTYGVAKGVQVRGVRVLGCNGGGTLEDVIEGVDWVAANSEGPAVANMSFGGPESVALDTAVDNLAASGVFVSAAAGGSGADACGFSPAGASGVFAVAASEATDRVYGRNNVGPCVKLYAPGALITSTWLAGDTLTLSGSSMAAPHVVGVAARVKSRLGDLPSQTLGSLLVQAATPDVLTGVPAGTADRLLFAGRI